MKPEHVQEMLRILRKWVGLYDGTNAKDEVVSAGRAVLSAIDAEAKGEKPVVERDSRGHTIHFGNPDHFKIQMTCGNQGVRLKAESQSIFVTWFILRWLRDHGIDAALEAMEGEPVPTPTPTPKPPIVHDIQQEHAKELYRWAKNYVDVFGRSVAPVGIISAIESSWPQPWEAKNGIAEVGMLVDDPTCHHKLEIRSIQNDRILYGGISQMSREYFRNHCELFRIVPVEGKP